MGTLKPFFSFRNLIKTFFIILFLIFQSCSKVYLGSHDQALFDEINQSDRLNETVENWEDGTRTDGEKNEFEWWYFDAELDDGSLIVAYFYKVHFLKDQYFIGFNYTSPENENFFRLKYFNKNDVSFSKDSCLVLMNDNSFTGNLKNYNITLDPSDFDNYGFDLNLYSLIDPYRPQDGIINAGDEYFAWLAAVPNGEVEGTVTIDGVK